MLDERFGGTDLDRSTWLPCYLPQWSSRAAAAADWSVADGELRLRIGPDHPLWCPDRHDPPLRVSCVQTGCFAGPLGSTVGQQPFRDGLTVREEQPTFRGYTPHHGRVEVRMRGTITERSMIAFWMAGFEDRPERSGEICVAEIFGSGLGPGTAEVGVGVHRFRDPALVEEFGTVTLELDVAEDHTYAVDWAPGAVTFVVDGSVVRRVDQAPDYPMQLMIGVFDFPDRTADPTAPAPVAELVVSRVRGT